MRHTPKLELVDVSHVNSGQLSRAIRYGGRRVVKALAERGMGILKEYFASGGPANNPWKQLSQVTVNFKGHSIKLIRSSEMEHAIGVRQIDSNTWEYGVYDWKASIHEYGVIIPVTDKMRAYMAAMGFPLRQTTEFIKIPARPFMGPSFDQLMQELPEIEDMHLGFFGKASRAMGF